jgi:hypothetical protein
LTKTSLNFEISQNNIKTFFLTKRDLFEEKKTPLKATWSNGRRKRENGGLTKDLDRTLVKVNSINSKGLVDFELSGNI